MTTAYKGIVWKAKVEGLAKAGPQFDKAAAGAKKLDKNIASAGGRMKRLDDSAKKFGQNLGKAGGIFKSTIGDIAKGGAVVGALSIGVLKLGTSLAGLYGRTQDVNAGFQNLAKSAGLDAAAVLAVMQKETRGTVDSMFLMTQANNAMLLGLPVTEELFGKLSRGAFLLSKAVGKDAAFGFESLITGIGRQSRMMLDNLGIIVDSERAYKAYAEKIGVSVDALTEQQRKLAFTEASMKAIEVRLAAVGELESTATDKLGKFNVGWIQFKTNIGKAIVESGALDEALASMSSLFGEFKAAIEADPDLIPSIFRSATTTVIAFGQALPGLIGLVGTLVEHSKTLLVTWLTIKGAIAGARLGSLIPGGGIIGALVGGAAGAGAGAFLTSKLEESERAIRGAGSTNININNQISPVFSIDTTGDIDSSLDQLKEVIREETVKPLDRLGNDFYRVRQEIRLRDRYTTGTV